jgi:hypothetical protein
MPAPRHNDNATGHQLYSKSPLHRVEVTVNAPPSELAKLAKDLGDASLWIAERLDVEMEVALTTDVYKASALYASVAHELHQLAGELQGEVGIKASPLGTLDEAAYERMVEQQSRALTLILSQCMSAWISLSARVEVLAEKEGADHINRVLTEAGGKVLPVLNYLAGHMRAAKRMMRDLAANRAWQLGMTNEEADPAARIMAIIEQAKKEGQS